MSCRINTNKRKYELTDEAMVHNGIKFRRIRAITSFSDVQEGDLGGWIEHEDNLSHDGNCWVYDEAKVSLLAKVLCDARVMGFAMVTYRAVVTDSSVVKDNSLVNGAAYVCERALIQDNALIGGSAIIAEDSVVGGKMFVGGDAMLYANASVFKHGDIMTVSNMGKKQKTMTAFRNSDGDIMVSVDYIMDSIDGIEERANNTDLFGDDKNEYIATFKYVREVMRERKMDDSN